jgi:flavin-dependent dehydrogenase
MATVDLISGTGPADGKGEFDLAIIGGGLAGLALSIQMADAGFRVALFEKETFPFHRVCGEYISMESYAFLESLGLEPDGMRLPLIGKLMISAPDGRMIRHDLPQGGFGISRYLLDDRLAGLAREKGVFLFEGTRVTDVDFREGRFSLVANGNRFNAKAAAGCFGKRSNLDIKWKRPFTQAKPNALNNYIGVKYHVRADFPDDTIALHNFEDGYCGISAVEGDRHCLCYLTTAANLRRHGQSIPAMEAGVLTRNPHLKRILDTASFERDRPVSISQVSFQRKSLVEDHMLMIGDAAGMITPLCGNGMSMAMHGSKIAASLLTPFLHGRIGREEMERIYEMTWEKNFSSRLRMGRMIQSMFGSSWVTNAFLGAMRPFPALITALIRQTHGKPF